MTEAWPSVKVERFDGEELVHFERRRAEICSIIEDFRWNRYDVELADAMEQRLVELHDGLVEVSSV